MYKPIHSTLFQYSRSCLSYKNFRKSPMSTTKQKNGMPTTTGMVVQLLGLMSSLALPHLYLISTITCFDKWWQTLSKYWDWWLVLKILTALFLSHSCVPEMCCICIPILGINKGHSLWLYIFLWREIYWCMQLEKKTSNAFLNSAFCPSGEQALLGYEMRDYLFTDY